MMASASGLPPSRRGRFTLADMAVLILGCALASALPWACPPSKEIYVGAGRLAPAWYVWLFTLGEGAEKAALALTPLMLRRRHRLGGRIRPGEFLLLVYVGYLLHAQAYQTSWYEAALYFEPVPGQPNRGRPVYGAPFWFLHFLAGWAFGLSALVLIVGRRKLSERPISWLLVVGFLGFFPWTFDLFEEVEVGIQRGIPAIAGPRTDLVFDIVRDLLTTQVPVACAAVAMRDGLRRRWRWSAMEWAGLAVLCSVMALGVTTWIYGVVTDPPRDAFWIVWMAAFWPMQLTVAGLIAWKLGPRWSRWLATRYDRCEAESRSLEG